ncbi:Desumoylating isopeptidase 1 [Mactra antiquata]
MANENVKVYIYDLSHGMARAMSQALLGKQLEGIWHTGIVVYGQEFFYGGTGGIECCPPGGTILGQPTSIHDLGQTQIPYEMFVDYLQDLATSTFGPFGQMIRPFIDAMSVQPSGGHALFPTTNSTPSSATNTTHQSDTTKKTNPQQTTSVSTSQPEKSSISSDEKLAQYVYTVDIPDISWWTSTNVTVSQQEQNHIKEVYEFISQTDHTWSLGRDHMSTLQKLALDCDIVCSKNALNILCRLVLKEDIVQMWSHDPKSKFPEILAKFDGLTEEVQVHVLKMLTNCCSLQCGHKLLKEKYLEQTTLLCVSSLLSEQINLVSSAVTLCYNLSLGKLSDDTALELGSAILNCTGKDFDTETVYHLLGAIYQLMKTSEEVKGLAGVLGVDFNSFKEKSTEIGELCDRINKLL